MAQRILDSSFRSALQIRTEKNIKEVSDNYLLDLIRQFVNESRVKAFFKDTNESRQEYSTSLMDVAKLREAHDELKILIKLFTDLDQSIITQAESLIESKKSAGITNEGIWEIYPKMKHENGSINKERYLELFPDVWEKLKQEKIQDIETYFEPTLGETRKALKKLKQDPEQVINPGKEVVIGYDIKMAVPGEKTSEGVEC